MVRNVSALYAALLVLGCSGEALDDEPVAAEAEAVYVYTPPPVPNDRVPIGCGYLQPVIGPFPYTMAGLTLNMAGWQNVCCYANGVQGTYQPHPLLAGTYLMCRP